MAALLLALVLALAGRAGAAKLVDTLATLESFDSKVLKLNNGAKITTGESPLALKALRGYRADMEARVNRMERQDKRNRATELAEQAKVEEKNHVTKQKIVGDSRIVKTAERVMSVPANGKRPTVVGAGVVQKYEPITKPGELDTLRQLLPKTSHKDLPQVAVAHGSNKMRTSSQYAGVFRHTTP